MEPEGASSAVEEAKPLLKNSTKHYTDYEVDLPKRRSKPYRAARYVGTGLLSILGIQIGANKNGSSVSYSLSLEY